MELQKLIFRSLHVIDPRIKKDDYKQLLTNSWEKLGSRFEEDFLFKDLPYSFKSHGDFIIQCLAIQRSIDSILGEDTEYSFPENLQNNFIEQRTDFSIEFPYDRKGIVVEVDGPQHSNTQQMFLDTQRDQAVTSVGWHNTVRIKTSEFSTEAFKNKFRIFIEAIDNPYINQLFNNYKTPIWDTPLGYEILNLSLIPFAIARFQRTLIEAIAAERLSLEKDVWHICVIERDVPFAKLALDDLLKLVEHLNSINPEKVNLPDIKLEIYNTQQFTDCQFQFGQAQLFENFESTTPYDLLMDIALLERTAFSVKIDTAAFEVVTIRSSHFINSRRLVKTSDLISYSPFCTKTIEEDWVVDPEIQKHLEYLLQSFFRKIAFRPGQLPIMHNALQCKSVIGLLQTGGGKSLTYQLSALLQPGICLVIDPIRSLMKDQVDGLHRNLIDSCLFINSLIQGKEKRDAMKKVSRGGVQFVFVSPERLQIEDFRNMLKDLEENSLYFSYCVIDEAHCVSEWGHDFRTAYLRLGENAMRYCKTANLEHLPLFGLTATASYDVLADVQRELSGNEESLRLTEDAIIRSEFTKRSELQYLIEEVKFSVNGINNIWDLKATLGSAKQKRVKDLLQRIPETIEQFSSDPSNIFLIDEYEFDEHGEVSCFNKIRIPNLDPNEFYINNNAALIFCPHTKGVFGVTDKFKVNPKGGPTLRKGYYDVFKGLDDIRIGYFMGSSNDSDGSGIMVQEESIENQDKFINSEINLMIATKAFGMGIDKENIRYTIHVNYPGSIESFVQESGRAGRDGKMAISYILYNDQEVSIDNEPFENDLETNMYFHRSSFKGVDKELVILDELLTEIHFPDRTFEIENLIYNQHDVYVKCKFWEGGSNKRLYIDLNFNEKLGFIDLVGLTGNSIGSCDQELSKKVFSIVFEYLDNLNLNEPVYQWLQRSDKKIGIEKILESLNNGDEFRITVGFYNNTKDRIKTLTKWLHEVIHPRFDESVVRSMKENSFNADDFIEEVCNKYAYFTNGQSLDFEKACFNRDKVRGNKPNTALRMFSDLYNGYRDKNDTEKAIYRLSTLGIIDDYTVDFNSGTFSIIGKKRRFNQYNENLRNYLLKYYSQKTTNSKLKKLTNDSNLSPIRNYLNFLVSFVYDEIKKKREIAIHDMKKACRLGLDLGNKELKEYIDLYFNSKYARSGYSYIDKDGIEIKASLTDFTDNGKKEDIKLVFNFIKIVENDTKAGQINNLKHLRGACTRMLRNQPDNYTILLLSAYSLYMLEFKHKHFLYEAEDILIHAFTSIQEKEPNYNENALKSIFIKFTTLILDYNPELSDYMEKAGLSFDFNTVMISRLLDVVKKANQSLISLNKILK